MIDKIIIFGAGRQGRCAYHYYRDKKKIECFIDNRESLWDTELEGIPICPPEILPQYDLQNIRIVIAVKNDWEKVQEQLFKDYQITKCILFGIEENVLDCVEPQTESYRVGQEIIICYSGGLGNQMFQYALTVCFRKRGRYVTRDSSAYDFWEEGRFELSSVFPHIFVAKCNHTLKQLYEKWAGFRYCEAAAGKSGRIETDLRIFEREKGIFQGYWQSYRYVDLVKTELLNDFVFQNAKDRRFHEIKDQISMQNMVSVHIRRGDYLQFGGLYGDICTDLYYDKAIDYISKQTENIIFCFFSDDITWVKEKYAGVRNSFFISRELFENYEDWYDMCLMSCCKHNIIANSTFSWWGAWLNQNPKKIVIAPKKWFNGTETPDICPPDWVRI